MRVFMEGVEPHWSQDLIEGAAPTRQSGQGKAFPVSGTASAKSLRQERRQESLEPQRIGRQGVDMSERWESHMQGVAAEAAGLVFQGVGATEEA